MVNFLLGLQSGYIKYPCFICLWDSRARQDHWTNFTLPIKEGMVLSKMNVIHPPLVSKNQLILPPLHIKLEIMKQFVRS